MPWCVVTSCAGSDLGRCTWSARLELRPVRGTVTSTFAAALGHSSQSAAAEAWLSAAAGPHVSTAAIQRPYGPSTECPTAKTPWCTRCRRPARTRRVTALFDTPSRRSWAREMTPCWLAASAPIATSSAGGPDAARSAVTFRPTVLACADDASPIAACGPGIAPEACQFGTHASSSVHRRALRAAHPDERVYRQPYRQRDDADDERREEKAPD